MTSAHSIKDHSVATWYAPLFSTSCSQGSQTDYTFEVAPLPKLKLSWSSNLQLAACSLISLYHLFVTFAFPPLRISWFYRDSRTARHILWIQLDFSFVSMRRNNEEKSEFDLACDQFSAVILRHRDWTGTLGSAMRNHPAWRSLMRHIPAKNDNYERIWENWWEVDSSTFFLHNWSNRFGMRCPYNWEIFQRAEFEK